MGKNKKGDVNLLLFALLSAAFVLGIAILWSRDWMMEEEGFMSKSSISKDFDEHRDKYKNNVYESFGISDNKEKKDNKYLKNN